jgi:small subunit ribosomal protein S8
MMTDPISDLLTRIRNGAAVRKRVVEVPYSRLKLDIISVLKDYGYITNFKVVTPEGGFKSIKIALKYDPITKASAISRLERVSRPGLRKYSGADRIPRVMNGLGISILSTSKGVMTGKRAKQENVGGEILCVVS